MDRVTLDGRSAFAAERARVRAHLEAALRAVERASVDHLDDETRARRSLALQLLRAYIEGERFPRNDVRASPTPIFVDAYGARCAVAALLEATGEHELVAEITARDNFGRVRDLARFDGLASWLERFGLTVGEAAAIQPAYHEYHAEHWQPTVAIMASALGGVGPSQGAHAALGVTVRAGARRVELDSAHGIHMSESSLAVSLEYGVRASINSEWTQHVGLVGEWEPYGDQREVRWYMLAGPLAQLPLAANVTAWGLGVQAAGGMTLRRWRFPLLVELNGHVLGHPTGTTARIGAQLGVVW